MPRSRNALCALGLVAAAIGLVATGAAAQAPVLGAVDEAGWQGVLGARPTVSTAQRYVVVVRAPSLASKVASAGGEATEAQMRRWTAAATSAQEQFLARMTASGAKLTREYRYVRVLNGFSARLDPTTLQLLDGDREVAGVYPVRIAYPAAVAEETGAVDAAAAPGLDVPGLDGTGVTVALLDTGVDPSHPYLHDKVLPGLDVIDPGSGGIAQPNPSVPGRPERHGTELAGVVSGADGPDGLHGVAPGASIFPIRIAGWQPDAEGGYATYSRTDQIIAGLEAAVDPNADGDAHDAARIALVGVAEPYASFPDGPLARAVAGATALDVLVVAPSGNDGSAGPSFGNIGGPGGAPDALTVGAADGRPATPTVRLFVRAGLRVLFDGVMPLGGAPGKTVTAAVVPVSRNATQKGISALFEDGVSSVAGQAALLPKGALSEETVEEATAAGAVAVLGDGAIPAGSFSLDVPAGVPVVGLPDGLARTAQSLLASGIPVTVSVGAVGVAENGDGGSIATFSSRGLGFGGTVKPELTAPGVAVPTSEPGRGQDGEVRYGTVSGTSVSAAVVAGSAAVLAEGHPQASAAELAGLLVGSAQPLDSSSTVVGSGMVDLRTAVQQEAVAEPSAISFGTERRSASEIERTFVVRNVSARRLSVSVDAKDAPVGMTITADPSHLRIPAGSSADVVLHVATGALAKDATAATGVLVLHVGGGSPSVRVPWGLALPSRDVRLVSQVSLRTSGGRVSDATPDVLGLVAGAVVPAPEPQVRPVDVLVVQLWRRTKLLGALASRRELLPGRYTFGLTGRGPNGERLRRGKYTIRIVVRPDDGTRVQAVTVPYTVR